MSYKLLIGISAIFTTSVQLETTMNGLNFEIQRSKVKVTVSDQVNFSRGGVLCAVKDHQVLTNAVFFCCIIRVSDVHMCEIHLVSSR